MHTSRAAVAAAVAFACASTSFAGDRPVASVAPGATSHTSLDSAALAALAMAAPLSLRFEFGGALVNCAGAYYFTAPVTSDDERRIDFDARVPKGCTLAGLYHTHPGVGVEAAQFPVTDVEQARALNVRSYIAVAVDGTVRVYDPATMAVRRDRARLSVGVRHPGIIIATTKVPT